MTGAAARIWTDNDRLLGATRNHAQRVPVFSVATIMAGLVPAYTPYTPLPEGEGQG